MPDIDDQDMRSANWDQMARNIEGDVQLSFVMGGQDMAMVGIAFDVTDEDAVVYARSRSAELIANVRETTRTNINRLIVRAIEDGIGPDKLRQVIIDDFMFSTERAARIARTEMGFAYNAGALKSLERSETQAVKVLDGLNDDSDLPCLDCDGKIIRLSTAQEHLLQHPNCVRSFSPVPVGPDEEVQYEDDEFLRIVSADKEDAI